jgi:hypothetical protein
MNQQIESVYLIEILAQCRNALRAERAMQRAARALTAGKVKGDAARRRIGALFDDAADFLSHAANVSKLLSPSTRADHCVARGRHLRTVLNLTQQHALADRTLRNHLEHYDERIDDWAAKDPQHLADGIIGPAVQGVPDSNTMRRYDPATGSFVFRGQAFDLNAIGAGLRDLTNRARRRLQQIAPQVFAELRKPRLI